MLLAVRLSCNNLASDPRSLLKGLIEDGFVAKTDTEYKCFTLEDLEFDGLSQIPLPEVVTAPPTQPQTNHLAALISADMIPPIPGLIQRSQDKGKGKAMVVEAASKEESAPEDKSTVIADPVLSSAKSSESGSEEEAVVHAHKPSSYLFSPTFH
ncbi:hypothetical protein BT96DRAFT_1005006 [Gymnopus androsaceus JB14]|uniref:Uncharacterized protein n=1 Tax=Gymnopus androsaceus JB14 TaxID=1447944 RepID=A0A6A4GP59_9AGAR|nr:hypothetical protein BT96DRAFT_1005006 [Gymnopus androsaceus JB14]